MFFFLVFILPKKKIAKLNFRNFFFTKYIFNPDILGNQGSVLSERLTPELKQDDALATAVPRKLRAPICSGGSVYQNAWLLWERLRKQAAKCEIPLAYG